MVNLHWDPYVDLMPPLDPEAKAWAERLYQDLRDAFPAFVANFEWSFYAWREKWSELDPRKSSK